MSATGALTTSKVNVDSTRTSLTHSCRYIYSPCNPVTIKPGHLVEAQVSFCTVPISKGRNLMLSKLRSLCILDSQVFRVRLTFDIKTNLLTHPKDMNDIAFEAMKTSPRGDGKKLKRKVGYVTI